MLLKHKLTLLKPMKRHAPMKFFAPVLKYCPISARLQVYNNMSRKEGMYFSHISWREHLKGSIAILPT